MTSLAWVCAASFGVPVVPPVWKRAARSVAEGGSPTKRSCGCSAASADRWPTRTPSIGSSSASPRRPRSGAGRAGSRSRPRAAIVRALSQTSGARSGPAATRTRAPDLRSSSAMCSPGQAAVDRRGDAGELCRQRRGDQLVTVRSQQGDPVGAAHAERVEHVGVAVHVGQQLGEGALRRLLPPVTVRQDGQGDPVRPQAGGPDEELVGRARQATVGQRHGLDRGEVARAVVRRPEEVAHHALLTTVRCRPRSMAPSSVPIATSTTSPCLEVLGVLGLALEEELPLQRGRQERGDDLDRLRRRAQGGARRGPGQEQVARVEALEPAQRLQRHQRGVDHVVVDHRVLAQLAVDPQPQPQVAEPLELVGVEEDERGSDRREGRVGLGLEELGLRQLDVAGRHVVGHHQAGDERGPVLLGDLRCPRAARGR